MDKRLYLLAAGMFVLGFDAYVIAGLLPNINLSFHDSPALIGQAVSAFTLCYALAAPLFATLFANKPLRSVLLIALAIFSIANAMSAVAPSITGFIVARAITGIGAGLFAPLAVAAATALTQAQLRGRALGLILGGMSSGVVIGVPLGLAIADYLSWRTTLGLLSILSLGAWLGLYHYLPNIAANSLPSLKARLSLLKDWRIVRIISVTLLLSMASLGLYTYIALVLCAATSLTISLWCWGIGGMLGSLLIGRLIDHSKQAPRILLGNITLLIIAISLIPFSQNHAWMNGFLFALWGASGWSSLAPQQHALIETNPQQAGIVVALNSSANYLGSALGASISGLVLTLGLHASQLPFLAVGFLMIGFILQLTVVTKR